MRGRKRAEPGEADGSFSRLCFVLWDCATVPVILVQKVAVYGRYVQKEEVYRRDMYGSLPIFSGK